MIPILTGFFACATKSNKADEVEIAEAGFRELDWQCNKTPATYPWVTWGYSEHKKRCSEVQILNFMDDFYFELKKLPQCDPNVVANKDEHNSVYFPPGEPRTEVTDPDELTEIITLYPDEVNETLKFTYIFKKFGDLDKYGLCQFDDRIYIVNRDDL